MLDQPTTHDKTETLSDGEYMATQGRIELLCRLVLETDEWTLRQFIQRAESADAFAPFIDPTAWNRAHKQLKQVITHARGIEHLRQTIVESLA